MEQILPISDLQTKTKRLVDGVKKTGDAIIITQRGRPAALLVNYEAYRGMIATIEEMSQPDWKKRLSKAKQEAEADEYFNLEEVLTERKRRGSSRKVPKFFPDKLEKSAGCWVMRAEFSITHYSAPRTN